MIRLQRIGKKKSPSYRFVVSEKGRDTQAKALEILGSYNPVAQPKTMELKVERVQHWLSQGAQPSATVHNLLVKEGVLKTDKQKSVVITNKRQGKIDAKVAAKREAEEAAKAAEEEAKAKEAEAAAAQAQAAKEAEEQEAAAEQTPTEETPAQEAEAPKEDAPAEEEKPADA